MDTKLWIGIAVLALLIGAFAGAVAFPTTETKTVTVTNTVEVPVEVEKVVPFENTTRIVALEDELEGVNAEFTALKTRWEQLVNEGYDAQDVSDELAAIARAEKELQDDWMYKFLIDDYKITELDIVKFYEEDARIREVRRTVDGKRVDYDKASVTFDVKVRYENDEGSEYQRFHVFMTWDIDSDGDEHSSIEIEDA